MVQGTPRAWPDRATGESIAAVQLSKREGMPDGGVYFRQPSELATHAASSAALDRRIG
jgi:hypothetical protein